jgi:hypothetical protein
MKAKFAPDEWSALKLLCLQVIGFVVLADGEIDDEEYTALNELIRDAPFYRDDLHRELMLDIAQDKDLMSILKQGLVRSATIRSAPANKALLRSKLTAAEYNSFTRSLIGAGISIAQASGVGNAGQGKGISREEDLALDTLIGLYEVEWNNPPATG